MSGPRYWAVIPAAGIGRRMGDAVPKQYLQLHGRAVIAHTLERICNHPRISGVMVAVRADDDLWPALSLESTIRPERVEGAGERFLSVLNALVALDGRAAAADWVLVHDAVRPCVRAEDIDRLIELGSRHPDGAVLGVPVRDTMKRTREERIAQTVCREGLWHAHTPQMFAFARLRAALEAARDAGRVVTDEAQAMEGQGARPRMVEGRTDNIKITRREDLALAELYLGQQERGI